MRTKSVHKFLCNNCKYVYDPRTGDGRFPPNTAFEDLPVDWVCPKCGVDQINFRKKYEVVEIEVSG